ncbi:MAG: thiamine pyrophosphate-binding protein [Gammaproteobacteria bacterium]|nr:thiamine pyrophosphate-binding protein [Gammaproteobacteria bacterium]
MKIKVSEFVVRYLERLGIKHIFGMPGAHILPVYDALYDSKIEAVLAKHEQGAAFMAGGYSRASGEISACITTAGPGATNLVTGIANAYADQQPILVITGETSTHIFGKGGLQESSGEGGTIDQSALFKGISKYHKIVERTDYLPQVLNRTSQILLSPSSGPVVLSFPYNIQQELIDESLLDHIKTDSTNHPLHDSSAAINALADKILAAKHPVIVAGFGCIKGHAQDVVAQLSEQRSIPIASSLKAKGVISEGSPLSLGSLGVTSSGHAYKYIVERADLVIFLGAGFNERTSYLWDDALLKDKQIIQIDSNPEQLEKVFKADMAIPGDIHEVISGVLQRIGADNQALDLLNETSQYIEQLKRSANSDYAIFQSGFSVIEHLFSRIEQHFPEGAVIFDDNIIFAQNFFKVSSGNRYYPNSGVSSLGHAIPAAIGARFSNQKTTFAILGDGGFQMCCMEIMTAVNYNRPLNIILFNNATMGLIRKNQSQQYNQRFINCDFINPDFEALSKSFGINYKRVDSNSDIDHVFENSDLTNSINLIEIMIDKDNFPNYSSRR